MKHVDIYTDGACSGNPGKGGYCAILVYGKTEKILQGGEESTTNNRMELQAVISGLSALKEKCSVTVYSDSNYVVEAINSEWLIAWQNSSWRTAGKKDVKNVDLWKALSDLLSVHEVKFVKVKGHSDNEYNNRCDKIAVSYYKNSNSEQ